MKRNSTIWVRSGDFIKKNAYLGYLPFGGKIVIDVMCGDVLAEKIAEKGGEIVWSKTGHSHIEHAMKNSGALFGGEQSGHIMFAENFFGYDEPDYNTKDRPQTAAQKDKKNFGC